MKHLKSLLLAVVLPLVVITVFCINISAKAAKNTPVSPALNVITSNLEMKKCGLKDSTVHFSYDEFDDYLNTSGMSSIKITSLPSEYEGKLSLGGVPVISGQKIAKSDINSLSFSPATKDISSVSFSFSGEGLCCESSLKCTLFMLDEINTSPVISIPASNKDPLTTTKNVMVYSIFSAEDQENDNISYEIKTEAEHGRVSILSDNSGEFTYTPAFDYTGYDRFEYVAVDSYGNRSESAWIEIDVNDSKNGVFFNDMLCHKDHNEAIRSTEYGLLSGQIIQGKACFSPNAFLTKAEFISIALEAAGINCIQGVYNTSLDDESDIPARFKGAVSYAVNSGIADPLKTEQGVYFYPNSPITRAEAAVIVNNILCLENTGDSPVFKDVEEIPSWAIDDISILADSEVMSALDDGSFSADSNVTNIQAAKIFCKIFEMKK